MSTELLVLSGHALTPLGLFALAAAGLALVVGLRPLLSGELLSESLFFLLLCLAVAVWLTGFGWMYGATDEAHALRWMRFAYLGVPIIPVALYTVAVHSLKVAEERRLVLAALWVAAAVFVPLLVATDVIVFDLHRYAWGWYPRFTPAGDVFVGFVMAGLGASLAEYALRRWRATREQERRRAGRFLVAFSVGSLALVHFLPTYGVYLSPLGHVAVPAMLVAIAHTIRHYHVVELTPGFAADRILATMSEPVLVVDREGKIRVANVAATTILGYGREELVGRSLTDLARGGGDPWAGMLSGAIIRSRTMVLTDQDGEPVRARVSAAPVTDRRDRWAGTVVVIRDLREITALRQKAFHDPLTGLPNRLLYGDRLEQLLRIQARYPDRAVAVLYLDLDGFKVVNDRLGHAAGDQLLERMAERLLSVVRHGDTAARLGGDEFAVVLGDLDADIATKEARRVAERARDALAEPVRIEGETVELGVSIGAAVGTGKALNAAELTDRADEAMYRAKAAPGRAIVIYRREQGEEERLPVAWAEDDGR